MSGCPELLEKALDAGLVVSAEGSELVVRAYGRPARELAADELCRDLRESKPELLRYLQRREQAIEMMVALFGRLAVIYPSGCSTGGPEWRTAEAAIDRAYRTACESGDFDALATALGRYEHFAKRWFAQAASRQRGERT